MSESLENLLADIPVMRDALVPFRELLLANAVMFAEIPSPTFDEGKRVRFMLDRLTEAGCHSVSTDEVGNALGIHPGNGGMKSHILVAAHLDTPFEASVDHTAKVSTNHISAPGILDNSMGLAAIATLPTLLDKLGIELKSNLILMGSSRSLGRGDIEGMRFFVDGNSLPLLGGVIVEGGHLGRLSYSSLGMSRGVVTVNLPENYDFSAFGAGGAIPALNKIISRIRAIPIPKEPATSIILGSVTGGNAYNTVARMAELKFEIRSEQIGMVGEILDQIQDICDEIGGAAGIDITLESVARRHNGGIEYNHPMVKTSRAILQAIGVKPYPAPSTGELAALIEKNIPGVTVGLTNGEGRHMPEERIEIEPIFSGLAQLITLIKAIDGGLCDVED